MQGLESKNASVSFGRNNDEHDIYFIFKYGWPEGKEAQITWTIALSPSQHTVLAAVYIFMQLIMFERGLI